MSQGCTLCLVVTPQDNTVVSWFCFMVCAVTTLFKKAVVTPAGVLVSLCHPSLTCRLQGDWSLSGQERKQEDSPDALDPTTCSTHTYTLSALCFVQNGSAAWLLACVVKAECGDCLRQCA